MRKTLLIWLLPAAVFFAASPREAGAVVDIDIETGAAFAGYNNVRIPGTTGTEFSLTDDLKSDPGAFIRIRITHMISDRQTLSFLVAPLRLKADGRVDREIVFENGRFPAGTPLHAVYRFDSYRLTYRYRLHQSGTVQFGLGLTAKIRDAAISLEGGGIRAEKTNTGFVPLINFRLAWALATPVSLLFEGDALAAPQGRAEDVLLAFCYQAVPRLGLKAGYRILEGGADVDAVYNFALVHYLVIGAVISF